MVKKGTYNYAIECMARNKHLLTIVTESWSLTNGTAQSSLKGKLKRPFIYLYNAVFQGIVPCVGAPLRQGVRVGGGSIRFRSHFSKILSRFSIDDYTKNGGRGEI